MPSLRRFGDLAGLLLQSHLRRREDEYQNELRMQAQQALSEQNFAQTVLGRIAQDPRLAQRARDSGVKDIGGFDPGVFVPSPEEALGGVGEDISKNPDQFDPLSIISKYQSQPGALAGPEARAPIEQLIQQRNSSLEARRLNAPRELKEETLPDGSKVLKPVNVQMMEDGLTTGLSDQQQGFNKLRSWQQFEGSPEYRKAGIEDTGRKAYAQHANQLAAEGRFYSSAEGRNLLKVKADAALSQAQSQAEGAAIVKAAEQTSRFLPSIIELEKKWQQAKPEIQRMVSSGAWDESLEALLSPQWDNVNKVLTARTIQSLPLTVQQLLSPPVRQYFEMRQTYMPVFARVLSEVGNLNEQEQLRAVGLAPSALDALDQGQAGDEKFGRMKRLMINAPDITRLMIRAVNMGVPPSEREPLVQEILGRDEPPKPLGAGTINEPDPDSPSERLRRLREARGRQIQP